MDELLDAFDPLHSSNGSKATAHSAAPPLFASNRTSSAASASSSSNAHSDLRHAPPTHTPSHHAPVSLSAAPLDLLSFDDNDESAANTTRAASSTISNTRNSGQSADHGTSNIASALQDRAAKRQENLLQELHNADQTFGIPSVQSAGGNTHSGSPPGSHGTTTRPTPRQRRPSSGFSPPRRMSKSGLMHDDQHYISEVRAGSDAHGVPFSTQQHPQRSPTLDVLGHAPSFSTTPSTQISEEPAVLFHPSSPPAGTTIQSLRQKSYFPPPPTQATPGQSQSIFDRPVASSDRQQQGRTSSSDRQAFHTLNDNGNASSSSQNLSTSPSVSDQSQARKPSGSRAAFIQNALRGPPPPFSSPSLKQSTSTQPQPIPGAPASASTSTASASNSTSQLLHSTVASPSSPASSSIKSKISRKPTFDFPLFSSLGSSVSSSNSNNNNRSHSLPQPPAAGIHIKDDRSGSNTPSPASSLIIDSDPLPSLVLKVTGAARDSRRVLTEDIADGVRTIKLCLTHDEMLRTDVEWPS